MVTFLAGLRAKEMAELKASDVLAAGSIRDKFMLAETQTKGRKARRVFVSGKLKRELAAYRKDVGLREGSEALLQSQKGSAFSANTTCQLFLNIYKQCGIEGASSHSGGGSLLTNLAARGVGVRVLAEIAGHSSIAGAQRYLDVNDEQMRAVVECDDQLNPPRLPRSVMLRGRIFERRNAERRLRQPPLQ